MSVNEKLAEGLHKPVKLKRKQFYATFKYNICATDLAEMGSLASKNLKVKYLLCFIDVFSKSGWVKHKKGRTVLNVFIELVNESNCKPDKQYID